MRLHRLQWVARLLALVAAAAAAGISVVVAAAIGQYALAAAALAAVLVRVQSQAPAWRQRGAAALVLVVAAIVGAAGGIGGPFLAALLLVVAEFGIQRGTRRVVVVGTAAAAVMVLASMVLGPGGAVDPGWVWPLAFVPLVGVTAGQIGGRQSLDGTAALESATAALDEVLGLAERIPAGFDRWSVANAVHLELVEASGLEPDEGPIPHLLLVQHGVLFCVSSSISRKPVGLLSELPTQRSALAWRRVTSTQLPAALAGVLDGEDWYLHRLGGDGEQGVVLVPQDVDASALEAVQEVLRPAAVALSNVARFERLQDVAVSSARTRVAHDLHDGVAQALTHVRFELDMLGLAHDELAPELGRIRRVADAALLDVRRTIGELREAAPLVERIDRHVQLLESFAPAAIEVDASGDLELPVEADDDVFRIVQEALSNAIRHAQASRILVDVRQVDGALSVTVEDDGVGIDTSPSHGVGLGAMECRAARLGGRLTVEQGAAGGTVVNLWAPMMALQDEDTSADGERPARRREMVRRAG